MKKSMSRPKKLAEFTIVAVDNGKVKVGLGITLGKQFFAGVTMAKLRHAALVLLISVLIVLNLPWTGPLLDYLRSVA